MMTEEVSPYFNSLQREHVILCGIEAHVCVMQTAVDLLADGKEVHIVCDAVSSQRFDPLLHNSHHLSPLFVISTS